MADHTISASYTCRSQGNLHGERWEFTANSAAACDGYHAEQQRHEDQSTSQPGVLSGVFKFFGINFSNLIYDPKPFSDQERATYDKMYRDLAKCHTTACSR